MVQADGMMGEVVLGVFTIGDGTVNIRATLGGAGVSALGGSGSLTLCAGVVCTTLVCVPGLFILD